MRKTLIPLTCLLLACVPAFTQRTTRWEPTINVATNINMHIEAERLDGRVNTVYQELGPLPTKDGKLLYFSRAGYPENSGGAEDEDIWYSEFDEETQSWSQAKNIGAPLNNIGPNFVTGIGLTGDTLLLANVYRKNGKMTQGVSVSVHQQDGWSFPVPINIEADYNLARRATYDVAHDRQTMIIAQHKADSQGNLDLYVTFREQDKKHLYAGSESVNLGEVINTPADETCPWLSYDGLTLYFASDGHDGYGRMDIFRSVRLDDTWTNWSKPENLGPGINSAYDELSFNFNPLGRYAYFSRGLSTENADIFRIDMTYFFINKEDTSQTGSRRIPVEIGQTIVIEGVFKDDGSAIDEKAAEKLARIVDFLRQNSSVEVAIRAHSRIHSTRDESLKISTERAKEVLEHLVANGVDRRRCVYQAFGHDIVKGRESKPASEKSSGINGGSIEIKIVKY